MTSGAFLELFASLSTQVAIVVGVAAWLVPRRTWASEAHRVWAACHVLILMLVMLAVLVPHLRLFPATPLTVSMGSVHTAYLWNSLGAYLEYFWLTGMVFGLLMLILGMLQTICVLRSAKPFLANDPASSQAVTAILKSYRKSGGESIQLLANSRTRKAFCWQIHQPYIVLPESMQVFPVDELQCVIRHEMAHLEAGHPMHLFLQRVVEILFWFHPLVWWASRQAAWSREFYCDATAVTTPRETASYLRGLLRLSEQRMEVGLGMPAGLAFVHGVSLVQRRADRLARRNWNVAPARWPFAAMVAPVVGSALLACVIWLPVNEEASGRSVWSPWPKWTATALHELGIAARDYELDGHRVHPHEHFQHGMVL